MERRQQLCLNQEDPAYTWTASTFLVLASDYLEQPLIEADCSYGGGIFPEWLPPVWRCASQASMKEVTRYAGIITGVFNPADQPKSFCTIYKVRNRLLATLR